MTDQTPPTCPPADLTADGGPYVVQYRKPGSAFISVALVTLGGESWRHDEQLPDDVVRVTVAEVLGGDFALAYHGATTPKGSTLLVARGDLCEVTDELQAWANECGDRADYITRVFTAICGATGAGGYTKGDSVALNLTGEQAVALAARLGLEVPGPAVEA